MAQFNRYRGRIGRAGMPRCRGMIFMGSWIFASASGCVERLPEMDEEGIPTEVQRVFNTSCAFATCHGGTEIPNLSEGNSSSILTSNSKEEGVPYVTFFDIENSWLAVRMLNMKPQSDSIMPPEGYAITQEDVALVIGWIGGAPLDDGGGSDEEDDTNSSTSSSESESTTEEPDSGVDTTVDISYEAVQAIWDDKCTTGAACHTMTAPVLTEDVSYDNLVDTPSTSPLANDLDRVEPNNLDDSFLWHRLNPEDYELNPAFRMPPAEELTATEFATIEGWILGGALE